MGCSLEAGERAPRPSEMNGALTWEQEHLTLLDANVLELISVDDAEEHATLVLVEPFLCGSARPSWLALPDRGRGRTSVSFTW